MRNFCQKMRTALFGILLCAFLSGCAEKETLMIYSETETFSVDALAGKDNPSGDEAVSGDQEPAGERRIFVHVCGAVRAPGVVELLEGSRAEDALLAAGGFAEDARDDYVNLAALVKDGEKLYFPTIHEAQELERGNGGEENALVNINTANAEQLCTLPGIGESRAGDIIAYRESNGGFGAPEDIMKVSGIKESVYEKLKDKITTE